MEIKNISFLDKNWPKEKWTICICLSSLKWLKNIWKGFLQVNFDIQFFKIDIIIILKYCLFRPERWFCALEFVCFEHVISNLLNTMFNANESLISCVLNSRCSHKNISDIFWKLRNMFLILFKFFEKFCSFGKNCQILRLSEISKLLTTYFHEK